MWNYDIPWRPGLRIRCGLEKGTTVAVETSYIAKPTTVVAQRSP